MADYRELALKLGLPWQDPKGPRRASLSQDGVLIYWCPGCRTYHGAYLKDHEGGRWTWNGSLSHPTITPSMLYPGFVDSPCCHHYVREGKLEFLRDCGHKLAGTTQDMEDEEATEKGQ